MIVLSHFQAHELLDARRKSAGAATTSLDLNISRNEVRLVPDGAMLDSEHLLSWHDIEEVAQSENTCFVIEPGKLTKVQRFSGQFNRFYTLKPTVLAPTMLISGINMHRIKDTDPHADTLLKIKALGSVWGIVLDTATGLGYTAIEAAKTAAKVTTIELDPAVLEVARHNPWSAQLFDNPRIEQMIGDSFDIVAGFPDKSFDAIIHDPPTFSLAGQLYSGEFYRQLFRVLRGGGKLFHYIGDLESRSGRVVAKGAVNRLSEAGFGQITRREEAFGLVATKQSDRRPR